MGNRTRDILLLTCCVAAIGAGGVYIHGVMTELSGAPVHQGEAVAERTGKSGEDGKTVEIRLTEQLKVGQGQQAQVVPSGTVLQVSTKLLPATEGPLRCKLGVQAGANDTPRVVVNSCAANPVTQRIDL